mgnify:CR=1 FL=1
MQQYLDRHRFLKGIYLMVRRYFDHHVGRDSAALTYYLLFALFPLLIFLSNLVGIMSVSYTHLRAHETFCTKFAHSSLRRRSRSSSSISLMSAAIQAHGFCGSH